jgi:hypothetical protein
MHFGSIETRQSRSRMSLGDAGTYPPCQRRLRVYCFAVRQVERSSVLHTIPRIASTHPHRSRFTEIGFLEGREGDQGDASVPATHPHRSRPYAAMALSGNLTKKSTRVNTAPAATREAGWHPRGGGTETWCLLRGGKFRSS